VKKYKVELMCVEKEYSSTIIEAVDEESAIDIAKKLDTSSFIESEKTVAHEWRAKTNWNFWNMLVSFLNKRIQNEDQ